LIQPVLLCTTQVLKSGKPRLEKFQSLKLDSTLIG